MEGVHEVNHLTCDTPSSEPCRTAGQSYTEQREWK
jgi:hypothetical protein